MISEVSVRFPGVGIELNNLPKGFNILRMEITIKGLFVLLALIAGFAIVIYEAHSTWQDVEMYLNLGLCAIIVGIIGSRICYVIYSWDYYKNNILEIFNVLNGGGSMYGGILAAMIPCIIVAGKKKVPILKVADTMSLGLALGQAVGNIGGLFSRGDFGRFTDGFTSMQIKYDEVKGVVNQKIIDNLVRIDGVSYIQVHPTFLYRAAICLVLFILLMIFKRFKKMDGDIVLWYVAGYSLGNIIVDFFRISSFGFLGTGFSLLQFVSALFFVGAVGIYIFRIVNSHLKNKEV